MAHNNYTHNTANNYDVQIVVDANPTGGVGTSVSYTDTGVSYYMLEIIPTQQSPIPPVFAANFTVDGVVGEFYWDESVNPTLTSFPEPPPHGIFSQQTIFKTYHQLTGTTTSTDNQPCAGPIVFDNTAYVTGAFLTDPAEITWGKIVLAETYEDDSGNKYVNGAQVPFGSGDSSTWDLPSIPSGTSFTFNSGYPIKIRAYVYLEYAPGFTGLTGNETINIDFDEIEPIVGCTDPLADNPTLNATIDDGSCTFSSGTHAVVIDVSIESSPSGISNGDYTDGSTYSMAPGFDYTTVNFSSGIGYGNIQLEGEKLAGTSTKTITLANVYEAGDLVTELVEFFIYPSYNIVTLLGLNFYYNNVYDYPFTGGPSANINTDPLYLQRMYWGWGDSKNNLTAASLRIRQPFIFQNWEEPIYLEAITFLPAYADWIHIADQTGLQPTQIVNFSNFAESSTLGANSITSSITAQEIYSTDYYTYPGYEFYPEKVKISISLDFTMPSNLSYNQAYEIPVNIYHNTENQGDLNWS
jgi:hypothetical protein